MDEVHIKNELVYDNHHGSLIGFVNLGDTNNRLLEFENALYNDDDSTCHFNACFDGQGSVLQTELSLCTICLQFNERRFIV